MKTSRIYRTKQGQYFFVYDDEGRIERKIWLKSRDEGYHYPGEL